jgi:hypothetical protein
VSLIAQFNVYYVVLLLAVDHRKREEETPIFSYLVGFLVAAGPYAANVLFTNPKDYFNENVMFL